MFPAMVPVPFWSQICQMLWAVSVVIQVLEGGAFPSPPFEMTKYVVGPFPLEAFPDVTLHQQDSSLSPFFWSTTAGFDQSSLLSLIKGTQISHLIAENGDKPCVLESQGTSQRPFPCFPVPGSIEGPWSPHDGWQFLNRLNVCRMNDGRTQSLTVQSVPTLSYFWMAISIGINT